MRLGWRTSSTSARLIDRMAGSLLARYIRYRAPHLAGSRGDGRDRRRAASGIIRASSPCGTASSCCCRSSSRPIIPTDIMLARHSDAEFLGEALKRFDMQLIRGAGAAGRSKDRGGSHAYRAAIQALRDGRAVAMTADVPGGQARKAGLGIVMAAQAVGQADPAGRHRHHAIPRAQHLEPDEDQPALLRAWASPCGPIVHVPREATTEELEGYRQEVEDSLNLRHPAGLRPRGRRSDAAPRRAARARSSTEPGLWLKTYRTVDQLGAPGRAAAAGLARAARQGGAAAAQRAPGPAAASSGRRAASPGFMPPASARPTPFCR